MLISSSFVSTAAWHTDQIKKVSDFATQLSSGATRSQSRTAPRHESAGDAAHPAAPAKAHIDRKSDIKNNRATPHADPRPEPHSNQSRRAQRKPNPRAEPSANPSPKPPSRVPPASTEEAPHFQAILSDVLPQDMPSSPNQADQTADQTSDRELASSSQTPSGPTATGTTGAPNISIQVEGLALPEKLGAAKTNWQSTAETSSAESTATASKGEVAIPQDSSLEITKQITSPDGKPPLNEKPAERAEVAFAMRVSERTTLTAALNLNDVQAAIAASRFDAASAGSHSNAREHAEARAAQPIQKGAQTSPAADATAEQSSLGSALTSAESSASQPAGPEDVPARSAGTPASARATSTISPAIAAATSQSAGGAQQPGAGINAPATSPATTQESRNAGSVKSPSEGRTPQFLDSQDQNAGGTPGSVRDISLKLTSKDQAPVQVRLSERAGELHVSVRTADTGVTRGLRDGLSDLVGHLEHNGYRAESWQPNSNGSSSTHDQAQDSPSHNSSSQQQNAGGSGNGNRQQQHARDHQEPETQTPKWVGELESSLQRSLRSWPPSAAR